MATPTKRQRLKLNEDEIATPEGAKFLTILAEKYHQGIDEDAVRQLGVQLEEYRQSPIPGVQRMLKLMDAVMSDGKVEAFELMQVRDLIYHILPTHALIDSQKQHLSEDRSDHSPPATERQLAYLEALTGERPTGLTLQEASDRISAEVEGSTGLLSHRQKMLVRFWNIEFSGGQCTKQSFSEHLDNFYAEDPNRKRAWELYKSEFGENPKSIPQGIGSTYLEKIKIMDDSIRRAILHRAITTDSINSVQKEDPGKQWNKAFFILAFFVILLGLFAFLGAIMN